ncbi:adhesion G-protein coupled receptor D1-like [Ruditapes philippinarum]|uniref:adhesion G-protein coupled receptor D1-like n=1 Tax=Ruditapes philippinarum TaxID=129788 RepID=UPI00295B96BD|nr:adhesion G-protein coupled receptor D1-like [Ruditapes philippinarum]
MGSVAMDGYGDENSCWLSAKSDLIWAFIVPALIVMLINMAIIILVIRAMFGTSALSKKSRNEKAVAGARSIAILMPIMGITWVLGVFSVNEDTVVFQYLFALFNSTQGVLIFVFHCAMNKKIQKAFRKQRSKWMSLRSYTIEKSMSNSMASSSMKSTRLDDGKESIM